MVHIMGGVSVSLQSKAIRDRGGARAVAAIAAVEAAGGGGDETYMYTRVLNPCVLVHYAMHKSKRVRKSTDFADLDFVTELSETQRLCWRMSATCV